MNAALTRVECTAAARIRIGDNYVVVADREIYRRSRGHEFRGETIGGVLDAAPSGLHKLFGEMGAVQIKPTFELAFMARPEILESVLAWFSSRVQRETNPCRVVRTHLSQEWTAETPLLLHSSLLGLQANAGGLTSYNTTQPVPDNKRRATFHLMEVFDLILTEEIRELVLAAAKQPRSPLRLMGVDEINASTAIAPSVRHMLTATNQR